VQKEKESQENKSNKLEPVIVPSLADRSEPLLLDEKGREIDVHGNVILGPILVKHPTSLANQRRNDVAYQQMLVKKRRENPYLSVNSSNANSRKRREFNSWVEPGKYIELGTELREEIKKEEEEEKKISSGWN